MLKAVSVRTLGSHSHGGAVGSLNRLLYQTHGLWHQSTAFPSRMHVLDSQSYHILF